MIFTPTTIPGCWLLAPERIADTRGFFARTFCEEEFAARGLHTRWVQHSVSFNAQAGTLRGMHYQAAPHAEIKLVRCTQGAIYDVALDLRPESPTHQKWTAVELSADNGRQLYIPEGCAHGFISLSGAAEVSYLLSVVYDVKSARGVRWNDPAFAIQWPLQPSLLSDRDAQWPYWPAKVNV